MGAQQIELIQHFLPGTAFDIPMGSNCVLDVCFGAVNGFADAARLGRMGKGTVHIACMGTKKALAHILLKKGMEIKAKPSHSALYIVNQLVEERFLFSPVAVSTVTCVGTEISWPPLCYELSRFKSAMNDNVAARILSAKKDDFPGLAWSTGPSRQRIFGFPRVRPQTFQ